MVDIKALDEETLYKIQEACAFGRWPEQIGEMPKGFDKLPNRKGAWQFWVKRTKFDYLYPIFTAARFLISDDFWKKKMKEAEHMVAVRKYSECGEAEKIFLICTEAGEFISFSNRRALLEYFSHNCDGKNKKEFVNEKEDG